MPCWTVTTVKTDVSKWDAARAAEAASMVYGAQYNARTKTLETYSEEDVAEVNKHYAALTLKAAARRFGWRVQSQTETQNGLQQYVLAR